MIPRPHLGFVPAIITGVCTFSSLCLLYPFGLLDFGTQQEIGRSGGLKVDLFVRRRKRKSGILLVQRERDCNTFPDDGRGHSAWVFFGSDDGMNFLVYKISVLGFLLFVVVYYHTHHIIIIMPRVELFEASRVSVFIFPARIFG
jgi:hypothetical protein